MARYISDLNVYVDNEGLITKQPSVTRKAKTAAQYIIGIGLPAVICYHLGDAVGDHIIAQRPPPEFTGDPMEDLFKPQRLMENYGIITEMRIAYATLGVLVGALFTKLARRNQ